MLFSLQRVAARPPLSPASTTFSSGHAHRESGVGGITQLAPAYDLPSTMFYGDATLALTIGGRDTLGLTRLRAFCAEVGLREAAIERAVGEVLARTNGMIDSLAALPFDSRTHDKVARQLATRRKDFGG